MKLALMSTGETAAWLGAACASARKTQRLTQAEVAVRAGVSPGTIKRLEASGLVDVKTLVSVLGALGALDNLERAFETLARPPLSPLAVRAAKGRETDTIRRVRHSRAAA